MGVLLHPFRKFVEGENALGNENRFSASMSNSGRGYFGSVTYCCHDGGFGLCTLRGSEKVPTPSGTSRTLSIMRLSRPTGLDESSRFEPNGFLGWCHTTWTGRVAFLLPLGIPGGIPDKIPDILCRCVESHVVSQICWRGVRSGKAFVWVMLRS